MPEPADLVCIGNITIDTSVQPDGSSTEALGGDALFATLAARCADGPARWFAPVGDDFPSTFVADLADIGLTLDGLPQRALPTVRNLVTYAADGSRRWRMACSEADFDRLSVHPADIDGTVLASRGVLVLAMSLASQLELVPWLRRHSDATLYVDVQEDYIAGNERLLLDMLAQADVVLPSEDEAMRLTGEDDAHRAAHTLGDLGVATVVVTLAERGCLVLSGGRMTHVEADAVPAVDPTGAGDAFCGAFAAVHRATGDAVRAARAGSAAARIAVSGHGVTALLGAVRDGVRIGVPA